jgi:hypothetical protein
MKRESEYAVYMTDTDGSERKACTVTAKSEGHAKAIARHLGHTRLTSAEPDVTTMTPEALELHLYAKHGKQAP